VFAAFLFENDQSFAAFLFENDQSLTVKAEFEIFAEAYLTFLNLYKTVAST